MSLIGATNEEKIWNFLKAQGFSDAGSAGVMGNLYAESGLRPENLQNTYEGKLGYRDAEYTEMVDRGTYTNFVHDKAGYGLCQWTFWSRKEALLAYAKAVGKSIGDLEMQLNFLMQELKSGYKTLLAALKTDGTVRKMSDAFLLQFERPADQSEARQKQRAEYGQKYFDKYAGKAGGKETMGMGFTNSSLATVKMISPNRTPNRNHVIDTITIHCYVGQITAERGLKGFASESREASCNYVIGHDGVIGLCVEEKDRSWCSGGYRKVNGVNVPIRVNGISGKSNDYQAVTIEVASDSKHPYAITEKAMAALIELCADICRRNGIKKLLWKGDKNLAGKVDQQNLTVHRWFANKACPGDYIYDRLGDIAAKVNAKLGSSTTVPAPTPAAPVTSVPYKVRITVTDLRIRKGPSTDAAIVQKAIAPGVYTIVSEATGKGATLWGKLKSGIGWVSLDFCKKL